MPTIAMCSFDLLFLVFCPIIIQSATNHRQCRRRRCVHNQLRSLISQPSLNNEVLLLLLLSPAHWHHHHLAFAAADPCRMRTVNLRPPSSFARATVSLTLLGCRATLNHLAWPSQSAAAAAAAAALTPFFLIPIRAIRAIPFLFLFSSRNCSRAQQKTTTTFFAFPSFSDCIEHTFSMLN